MGATTLFNPRHNPTSLLDFAAEQARSTPAACLTTARRTACCTAPQAQV